MTDLVLLPRDGMFLKDGSGWVASAAGRAHSLGWPMPSTLLGALRTACGRAQEARDKKAHRARDWLELSRATKLGPSFPIRRELDKDWSAQHRVWPVPADALYFANHLVRLNPVPHAHPVLTRGDHDAGSIAREALWGPEPRNLDKPEKSPGWWGETAFIEWMAQAPDRKPRTGAFAGFSASRHLRTHVGIKPETQAALDGALFAHEVVETLDRAGESGPYMEWGIACRLEGKGAAILGGGGQIRPGQQGRQGRANQGPRPAQGDNVPRHLATLGGDRRVGLLLPVDQGLFEMSAPLMAGFNAPSRGLRLVVVTPCAFAAGWLPDGFQPAHATFRGKLPGVAGEVILRAALIPRSTHVSGWDMAKHQPKPTTRLVPPGAVYFFVKVDGTPFTASEARALWLKQLGQRTDEGFGCIVPGIWHPTHDTPKGIET